MISKKELNIEIQNLTGLSFLVNAFEEIAASRIKRTRDSVLVNREYSSEINEILIEVLASYKMQVKKLMKSKNVKNINELSFINKNGKTLYLLISANTGLYGGIVRKTFELFQTAKKDENYDIAIIGKLGLTFWKQLGEKRKYLYFDFPDQSVDDAKIKEIVKFIIKYEKVVVFYGQFQNLLKQAPTYSDISGHFVTDDQIKQEHSTRYFFEPSLEKIMEFFEKQIFAIIFEQTVRESQLAKLASRLTALNNATDNIEKELRDLKYQNIRMSHQQQNKKQIEMFSSMILWKNS